MPLRRQELEPSPRLLRVLALAAGDEAGGEDEELGGAGEAGVAADDPWVPLPPGRREPQGRHRRPRPPGSGVVTVPTWLRDARWLPTRTAVLGVLTAVVVALSLLGLRVAWAQESSTPRVVAPASTPASTGPSSASSSVAEPPTTAGASGPDPPSNIVVHVVGQVATPGVVTLTPGARVRDAVAAAGGATKSADVAAINLARPVVDGEQIRVPKPGEEISVAPGGSPPGAAGSAAAPGEPAIVNLNTADLTTLETLPGVGPVLAQRILDWRNEHGRFSTVDELGEVSGIGEKMLAQLRPKVTT